MNDLILKNDRKSKQYIDKDTLNSNGTIDPFVDFKGLLDFYYFNVSFLIIINNPNRNPFFF